ncbi:vWA domain-containing protein [Pimelobacter simplex]|uniref:vWA domain-containing protein n=1 Tax=Nocardioides simplex TaxID=2045 RepID=UPI00214F6B53|nr:VWA domain-containing protein [Pimelobacter simplex]UUW89829.1 VWA domain-containing protein [Pimelobacter simplex]UUW93658.1 VWA domain-containing protein [Pimelobacter simplex]
MNPTTATALVVLRRVAIVLAFVAVLLRPGVGQTSVSEQLSDLDVLVVVDRTRSMAALDHDGRNPRIRGVQADLTALAKALPGARFGLLTFGAETRLVMPFSSDTTAFDAAVETIYLEGPKDGAGSAADRPVPELTAVLKRAQEQRPERRRIVVYAGDGENTTGADDSERQSFEDVRDLVAGGAVLGYGTSDGGPMPESDGLDGAAGYVRDPETAETAISHADLGNLREIADQLGVRFQHRTGPGDLAPLVKSFAASYSDGQGGHDRPAKHDLTWLAALVLLGLVLLELRAGWHAVWTSRHALRPARAPREGGRR